MHTIRLKRFIEIFWNPKCQIPNAKWFYMDNLVYEFYGITEEERKIIENG